MERLTRKDSLGYYIEDISIPYDEKRRGPDVDRLGAYEDKGVAPEDALSALEMAKAACKLVVADAYIATGLMPERVSELAQAEKDGRLVVLPCKVGDTVYEIEPLWISTICDKGSKCRSCKDFYEGGMGDLPCCLRKDEDICLSISEKTATLSMIADWMDHAKFGKTVFLTRQEAEEALRKEAAHG